jgi:hypothetical protein
MKRIVNIVHGSHLYGTSGPASDRDFKGIFVPESRDILLGRIPKTSESTTNDNSRKNESEELDQVWYSLHHFIRLATQGQTIAIEMLFAPTEYCEPDSEYGYIWDNLVANRDGFLCKRMQAFIGYARTQASKYSLKGERLARLEKFYTIVQKAAGKSGDTPMVAVWDELPKDDERQNPHGVQELQISGKWYGATTRTGEVALSVRNIIDRYGKRSRAAADAGGFDWKALSHALRVSYQLEDILNNGRLEFPLSCAELLRDIKWGKYDLELVQNALISSLCRIEDLMVESSLPDKVNVHAWDLWLTGIIRATLDD